MISDTELKVKGLQVLSLYLGNIEMERFVALIQRESFDYTEWRQSIADGENNGESIEEISAQAMALRNKA